MRGAIEGSQARLRPAATLTCWVAFVAGVIAHDLGRSESTILVRGAEVRVSVVIDLLEVSGVDANGDGEVSYSELDDSIDRVYTMVKDHLVVHGEAPPVRTSLEQHLVKDGHVGQLALLLTFSDPVAQLTTYSSLQEVLRPTHEHQTTVTFDGDTTPRRAILDAGSPEAVFQRRATSVPSALVVLTLGGAAIAGLLVFRFARNAFAR